MKESQKNRWLWILIILVIIAIAILIYIGSQRTGSIQTSPEQSDELWETDDSEDTYCDTECEGAYNNCYSCEVGPGTHYKCSTFPPSDNCIKQSGDTPCRRTKACNPLAPRL